MSTANAQALSGVPVAKSTFLANDALDPLLLPVVQATEEAIVNAVVAARDGCRRRMKTEWNDEIPNPSRRSASTAGDRTARNEAAVATGQWYALARLKLNFEKLLHELRRHDGGSVSDEPLLWAT